MTMGMIVMVMTLVVMLFMVMVVMILVIMLFMAVVVMILVVIIMDMHFSVKVLCFTPNKSRSYGCLNGKRAAIAKTPLKDTTEHAIDGVMPWFSLKVGIKSTVAFNGDDGREVEFTSLKALSTTTMGAVGERGRTCRKRKG